MRSRPREELLAEQRIDHMPYLTALRVAQQRRDEDAITAQARVRYA